MYDYGHTFAANVTVSIVEHSAWGFIVYFWFPLTISTKQRNAVVIQNKDLLEVACLISDGNHWKQLMTIVLWLPPLWFIYIDEWEFNANYFLFF